MEDTMLALSSRLSLRLTGGSNKPTKLVGSNKLTKLVGSNKLTKLAGSNQLKSAVEGTTTSPPRARAVEGRFPLYGSASG